MPHKSVESDEPYIAGLGALMHDTCNTANKAAKLIIEAKNAAAFAMLSKFQLTTEQQNEIAAMVDSDGMTPLDAATAWVEANADVVAGWMS